MQRVDHKGGIRYLDESGAVVAKVVIRVSGEVANITHTFVDESLRGQGIAAKLMEDAVARIRAEGHKARLDCPYARDWFQEHPEHFDLLYWSCDSNRTD